MIGKGTDSPCGGISQKEPNVVMDLQHAGDMIKKKRKDLRFFYIERLLIWGPSCPRPQITRSCAAIFTSMQKAGESATPVAQVGDPLFAP